MPEYHPQRNYSNSLKKILSISMVTYKPNLEELKNTLKTLSISLNNFENSLFSLTIIDNSPSSSLEADLHQEFLKLPVRIIHGQGNIGFGGGHNLSLDDMGEYHLVLNPDIELDADAIVHAISFMNDNSHCGLITPQAYWPNGLRQYLCKRFPSVFDLLLRGFAPTNVRSWFSRRLARYEMQAETQNDVYWNPPIVSGCFMFFRSEVLQKCRGFNDKYFLYFEDFDLSLRTRTFSSIAYVPSIRVVHSGGNASQKGTWHILIFISSALKFFRQYGVKIF